MQGENCGTKRTYYPQASPKQREEHQERGKTFYLDRTADRTSRHLHHRQKQDNTSKSRSHNNDSSKSVKANKTILRLGTSRERLDHASSSTSEVAEDILGGAKRPSARVHRSARLQARRKGIEQDPASKTTENGVDGGGRGLGPWIHRGQRLD